MLSWKEYNNSARCQTALARFSIDPDWGHMPPMGDSFIYEARVEPRGGDTLEMADRLPDIETAKAWCLKTYRDILQKELALLP